MLEKPSLLQPSPEHPDNAARRPADVYLPSWTDGRPAALDFAVTSPQRLDALARAAQGGPTAAKAYEEHKRMFLDTAAECARQGISFIPMVVEATGGGWGKTARGAWSELAKSSALATGELETERSCAIMLRQRLSMVLHRKKLGHAVPDSAFDDLT